MRLYVRRGRYRNVSATETTTKQRRHPCPPTVRDIYTYIYLFMFGALSHGVAADGKHKRGMQTAISIC